jgi:hypothetical protein
MAFRKRSKKASRRSRGKFTLPLAVVAGFIPGARNVYHHWQWGGFARAGAEASRIFLGYSTTNEYGYNDTIGFHPYLLKYGALPVLYGFLAHWVANKVGVNRMLTRMKIPIIRI